MTNVINVGEKVVARWKTSSNRVRHGRYEGTGV